ncbi:MAG: phosphodiester glycosidase family protein [Oscillospiraceae bacterium]|nr:phosphodiester glycosidase family protein [Oscillospiraceae bacterium]
MAQKKRRRRRKASAGAVLLGIVLSLALAGGAVAGTYYWASTQPGPALLREEKQPEKTALDLYVSPQAVTGTAPEPAAAPVPEEQSAGEEEFAEILGREEGLTVARVQGKRWRGFIALVEDPGRLEVATCPYFYDGAKGRTVDEMAAEHGAVLAINGGGFADDGGYGTGGLPIGNVVSEGKMLWPGGGYTVAMDYEGKIHVGEISGDACKAAGYRWALSYGPILIQNGSILPNLDTRQQEPRTAVGQREDGTVVLLNIQGRQASALGVTCRELAEIMQSYGCVNAGNLDGGASSDMWYRGNYVNISNISSGPRPIPTSLVVLPAAETEEEAQG